MKHPTMQHRWWKSRTTMFNYWLFGCLVFWSGLIEGEGLQGQVKDSDSVVPLTLHPAGEPSPVLQHRLLPPLSETRPGNAAVFYGKIRSEMDHFFQQEGFHQNLYDLLSADAQTLKSSDLAQQMGTNPRLTYYHHLAAQCRSCDWQLPIDDAPLATMILPEIQEARFLSQWSLVAARYQAATGDFSKALVSFQDAMAYGRNVGSPPTLTVNYLVGSSIHSSLLQQLHFFVQQPGAPNLYWALSTLPAPLIDDESVWELEAELLQRTFPFLNDLESDQFSREYWDQALQQVIDFARENWSTPFARSRPLTETVLLIRAYPKAVQVLKNQGLADARIQQMPVSRAILYAAFLEYQIQRDQLFRWCMMSQTDLEVQERLRAEKERQAQQEDGVLPDLFSQWFVSDNVHQTQRRIQRERDVLRVIEAIRLHGHLPKTLDEITEVPIPKDPETQQSFEYRLQGNTAYLTEKHWPFLWSSHDRVFVLTMTGVTENREGEE